MRGEHVIVEIERAVVGGSSPHARGTPSHQACAGNGRRFIPACAGNTVTDGIAAIVSAVHPRMRGEHFAVVASASIAAGSSPHARGTRRLRFRRSIPTPVHPRMRGEHTDEAHHFKVVAGSSPHARGTLQDGAAAVGQTRFIPACAGNTPFAAGARYCGPVHPRMRGEHSGHQGQRSKMNGSSPHARGTRRG